jgi:hypothetical protein
VGTDGKLNYTQTFKLANSDVYKTATRLGNTMPYEQSDLLQLNLREIVLHGMSAPKDITSVFAGLPNNGLVTFNKNQYDAFLPIAAGVIFARVAAVPEPADWGMMLGGLGLILGFLWLRRREVSRQDGD